MEGCNRVEESPLELSRVEVECSRVKYSQVEPWYIVVGSSIAK